MPHFIRDFKELSKSDVHLAGGKGASLGEMTAEDIPVPPGFVIIAPAFEQFLQETHLHAEIEAALDKVNYDDVNSVDKASNIIHDLIHDARMPQDLEEEILRHHAALARLSFASQNLGGLGAAYVAVRSSATAEDSSTASWAGELETYLNTTKKTLIGNVKKCWASLFTPRAIVYRNEKGMRKSHVSVAVIIQTMVQSQVAGVVFTVHPVTRDKNHMIIEACWGLGEMLVGGSVTPDSYVIDKRDGTLIDVSVSKQEQGLFRTQKGNTLKKLPAKQQEMQKLNGAQIRQLTELCKKIETHYAFPCDIEWGFAEGQFYILQSRPITTLR